MFLQQQLCRIVCLVAQHRAALANRRVCECCRGSAEVKRTNSREVRCLDCWLSRDLRYLQQPWQESCSNDPRRPNHSWHYHFLLQLRGRGRMGVAWGCSGEAEEEEEVPNPGVYDLLWELRVKHRDSHQRPVSHGDRKCLSPSFN